MNKQDLRKVTEESPKTEAESGEGAQLSNPRQRQPGNDLRVLCVGRIHKGRRTVVIAFHRKPTPIVPDSLSQSEDEPLDHGNDLHHERSQ
jgi:hypothetical protein